MKYPHTSYTHAEYMTIVQGFKNLVQHTILNNLVLITLYENGYYAIRIEYLGDHILTIELPTTILKYVNVAYGHGNSVPADKALVVMIRQITLALATPTATKPSYLYTLSDHGQKLLETYK